MHMLRVNRALNKQARLLAGDKIPSTNQCLVSQNYDDFSISKIFTHLMGKESRENMHTTHICLLGKLRKKGEDREQENR